MRVVDYWQMNIARPKAQTCTYYSLRNASWVVLPDISLIAVDESSDTEGYMQKKHKTNKKCQYPFYHWKSHQEVNRYHYCLIYSVRTNGPTLCPWLWLPYVPESVEKTLREARGFVMYTNA